ncbi:hydroxyphenylacetyl-CoA thioesterase PaaI [soil metagenome]
MTFDTYDPELADLMLTAGEDHLDGLPAYLGIRIIEVGPGTVTAELDVRAELLNPFGAAHGAVLSSLVDHVLGSAVLPLVPRGSWPATTAFKVNYLAPAREGPLRAVATVESLSKRLAVVRVEVTNGGRVVGLAQGTVAISAPR